MLFEFATATRIVFGPRALDKILPEFRGLGRRALLVSGTDPRLSDSLLDKLKSLGLETVPLPAKGEPSVDSALAGVLAARDGRCDFVIGIGGGSAIDLGKAISALLTNPGDLNDYLEVVGKGLTLQHPAAPYVAIPTTAGTGSEVTRNAVITCEAQRFKASLRSPHLVPRVALVDPALTHSMPPEVTASTGLDALTQLIEPYVCTRAQPLTDALALAGMRRVMRSLRRAVEHGEDAGARDDMALAALFGGMCLANAGLGAVHGFAAPLGASFPVPHGVACAALLPHVMAANVAALREQAPDGEGLRRYAEVSEVLVGRADVDAAIAAVAALVEELRIPRLSRYGLDESHVAELAALARRASSMRANPVELSDAALCECLRRAL